MNLETEIAETEAQIKPLVEKLERLTRQKREQDSRAYIAANKITRADVESSSGEGKPWFGVISEFIEWMRAQPRRKPWAEWNTLIYRTSDLLCGRMPESPARIDDLP